MITQSLFQLPPSKPLRAATLYPRRKDAVLAGGADLGAIVATHHSRAECPEAVMLPATTVARLALGVARGATAATPRSMDGTQTGRGISPRHKRPVRQADARNPARRPGSCLARGSRQPPNHPLSGSRLSSHQRRQNSAIRAIAIPSHSVMASTPLRRSTTSRLSLMTNRDDVH